MEVNIIEKAMRVAAKGHEGQMRKEEAIPYLSHPASVAIKLAKHGFPDIVIAAALVHDVLEDTGMTREEFRTKLGEEVLVIVEQLSEDKSLPWEDRKMRYIETIGKADETVKAVSIGDKIHNAESMLIAYGIQKDELWKLFTRGKEKQLWFMREMLTMFERTWKHPLVDEYRMLVERVSRL